MNQTSLFISIKRVFFTKLSYYFRRLEIQSMSCIKYVFDTYVVLFPPEALLYSLNGKVWPRNSFKNHVEGVLDGERTFKFRFGTAWRWVNDSRIFIFGRTIPLFSELDPNHWFIWKIQLKFMIHLWIRCRYFSHKMLGLDVFPHRTVILQSTSCMNRCCAILMCVCVSIHFP